MRSAIVVLVLMQAGLGATANAGNEQDHNKVVAVSFFQDVLDKGRFEHYPDSHHKDFGAHVSGGRLATLEEDIAAAKGERQALPDMRVHVDHVVAERDLVSVTWTASGTNTQPGMGFPATGKRVSITGMTLFRFAAGKIVEEWSVFDMLSVLEQLGLYPP
jgi:steroid delta-isomerase-like uncharacterized protein